MTPSPESRLLAHIRKKSGPPLHFQWKTWFKSRSLQVKRLWGGREKLDAITLWRWANAGMALVLIGTVFYGGFAFFRPLNPILPPRATPPHAKSERNFVPQRPTFSQLTQRAIFRDMAPAPPPAPEVKVPDLPPPPPPIPLSVRASRFRLVGILAGDNPQAILEDSQTQRTIYATRGQLIEGILVESVETGKVVLSADGEHFDITL